MNEKVESCKKYPLIDIMQYTASILVIFIHCGKIFENELGHFYLKNILCRVAVPLFLVISGFFYRQRQKKDPSYYKTYFRRQMKQYIFWSIVYLPYGFGFLVQQSIPPILYPIGLLIGFLYVGVCYHLWYIPALLLGLWLLEFVHKKWNYWYLGFGAIALYFLGMLETYSSYVKGTFFDEMYGSYKNIFITTRNGLFYALIFLLLGFLLADFKEHKFFSRNLGLKIIGSSCLLLLEGWLVFQNQGDDKNFLLMLLPLSLFLVAWAVQSKCFENKDFSFLRALSKYMYFLHPFLLELSKYVALKAGLDALQGVALFSLTVLLTTGATLLILMIEKRAIQPRLWVNRQLKNFFDLAKIKPKQQSKY